MKNLKSKKGFTLTELIIVIVIIGILAGVLIPSLTSYVNKAKKSAAEQNAETVMKDFIATADNEEYAELTNKDYIVLSNGYYVIFENGSLNESFLVSNRVTILNSTKALTALDGTDYIYLATSSSFDSEHVPTATLD